MSWLLTVKPMIRGSCGRHFGGSELATASPPDEGATGGAESVDVPEPDEVPEPEEVPPSTAGSGSGRTERAPDSSVAAKMPGAKREYCG